MKDGGKKKVCRKGEPARAADSPTPTMEELRGSDFARRKLEREVEICGTAQKVLSLCAYRRARNHAYYVAPSVQHAFVGMRRRENSFIQAWLASPMRWLEDVHRKALAAASSCFVFEVTAKQTDGSLIVIAGRQGRGCSVRLAYAVARPQAGSWRLEWDGLPAAYKAPPPNPKLDLRGEAIAGEYYHDAAMRRAVDALAEMYPLSPSGKTE